MEKLNIIVSNKKWNKNYAQIISKKTNIKIVYIDKYNELTYDNISRLKPDKIFFFHWSHVIPENIYENFECIIFHMTDLPFGRGGSPLQNLIAKGIYETKLSALRCTKELDAGPIYAKKELSLRGNAEEIYIRAGKICCEMAIDIINNKQMPNDQIGEVTFFKRRKPEDGNIAGLTDLNKVYDYIRMLDADTYPKAFLDIGNLHFEFDRAALKDGFIEADVRISIREMKEG